MTRFLAGLAAGLITGGITRLITAAEPWWLTVSAITAAICWFGASAVDAIADAITDLF